MKVRGTNTALALVVGLCLSSAAHAQLKDNIEMNAFGGGSWYSAQHFETGFPQSVTPVFGKFRMDNTWLGGLRLGVYSRGHWSQEFFFSYEPSHATLSRTTAPASSMSLSTKVINYGANAIYYLNDNESEKFRPFLSAGIGGDLLSAHNRGQVFRDRSAPRKPPGHRQLQRTHLQLWSRREESHCRVAGISRRR